MTALPEPPGAEELARELGYPLDTAAMLETVRVFFRRFVVLSSEKQYDAVALWVLHTHAIRAAYATPYLAFTSPEPGCGKSESLNVLRLIVARPWKISATPSEAVLFRKLHRDSPTVLFDEVDPFFRGSADRAEPIVAILNSGNVPGETVPRCVGSNHEIQDFRVFGPKALAGIDHTRWPDTITDRCIPIRLHKLRPDESVERRRPRRIDPQGREIAGQLEEWAAATTETLAEVEPADMEALSPRAFSGWEPLLAIAESAGGDWPKRAREAAIELSTQEDSGEAALGSRLLADIRTVAEGMDADRLGSQELCERLRELPEAPWGDLYGKPLNQTVLARRLRPYGITSKTVRLNDDKTAKGYTREQFVDAWARYLPTPPDEASQRHNGATEPNAASPEASQRRNNGSGGKSEKPLGQADVTAVTAVTPLPGELPDVGSRLAAIEDRMRERHGEALLGEPEWRAIRAGADAEDREDVLRRAAEFERRAAA